MERLTASTFPEDGIQASAKETTHDSRPGHQRETDFRTRYSALKKEGMPEEEVRKKLAGEMGKSTATVKRMLSKLDLYGVILRLPGPFPQRESAATAGARLRAAASIRSASAAPRMSFRSTGGSEALIVSTASPC